MQPILRAHLHTGRKALFCRGKGARSCWELFIHWFIMVPLKRHLVTLQFNVSVCGAENKTSTQTVITVICQSGRGHRASMGSRGCSEQPLCAQSPGQLCSSETASFSHQSSGRISLGYLRQQLLLTHYLSLVMNNNLPRNHQPQRKQAESYWDGKAKHKGEEEKK